MFHMPTVPLLIQTALVSRQGQPVQFPFLCHANPCMLGRLDEGVVVVIGLLGLGREADRGLVHVSRS
jgi:hypothetical protein